MRTAVFGNYGIRRLLDQGQRYLRAGLPAYLRVKNYLDDPSYSALGLTFTPPSPSGMLLPTGTTDIAIDPPPSIGVKSMTSIAFAQQAGVELRAGARNCIVSHSWVRAQMVAPWFLQAVQWYPQYDVNDPESVWRVGVVVGIVTDKLLLEIMDISHEDAYGEPMEWHLICNASQLSGS